MNEASSPSLSKEIIFGFYVGFPLLISFLYLYYLAYHQRKVREHEDFLTGRFELKDDKSTRKYIDLQYEHFEIEMKRRENECIFHVYSF